MRRFHIQFTEKNLTGNAGLVTLQYRRQFSLQIPWHGSPPYDQF